MLTRLPYRMISFGFANLNQSYYLNPTNDAVVFGSQATTWSHKQTNIQTLSLIRGFKYHNFIEDDVIMLRLAPHQHIEKFTLKITASNLRCKLVISQAQDEKELQQQLIKTKARALVFDSHGKLGDTTNIDALYRMIPAIVHHPKDKEIMPKQFRFLRYLVQTDYYPYRGTFMFQSFIKRGLRTEYSMVFDCLEETAKLEDVFDKKQPIIVTDPSLDLDFRAGTLNSLQNGYLLICAEADKVATLASKFNNNCFVVGSCNIPDLHEDVKVVVQPDCPYFKNHKNKIVIA